MEEDASASGLHVCTGEHTHVHAYTDINKNLEERKDEVRKMSSCMDRGPGVSSNLLRCVLLCQANFHPAPSSEDALKPWQRLSKQCQPEIGETSTAVVRDRWEYWRGGSVGKAFAGHT